jgi:peptide/nickel transport system ATP-binding protein
MRPLLELERVSQSFVVRRGALGLSRATVSALQDVDLAVAPGESVALVGESGCGKTTLARAAMGLLQPTAGRVRFDGVELDGLGRQTLRRLRRRFQIVFQDPLAALDPRQRIGEAVAEPLAVHGLLPRRARRAAAAELLARVGLGAELGDRFPHELSGGQRQRAVIARALATGPDLLVADEPLSSLDVSVRSQVLDLFAALRRERPLALLWITHDLASAAAIADRVAVLYAGRLVEVGPVSRVLYRPEHPYTAALLAAVPRGGPRAARPARPEGRALSPEEPPDPLAVPRGCPFEPRCGAARARCATERPELAVRHDGREVACFHPGGAD